MKRKLTSVVLAIVLTLSMSAPAFAADCQTKSSDCPETVLWQLLLGSRCGTQLDLEALLRAWLAQRQITVPGEQQPETPAQPEIPTQPETPTQPEEPAQQETPSDSSFMSAYEQEVVRLVNVERAKYGLAPLTADAQLTRTARMKSQDMHDKGYFDHNSPTYGSPFDLMRSQGVKYRTAGENIAMGYRTPEAVVNAWMNSSGHRANILNASYTKIGVGFVASGSYWTQHFTG